MRSGVSRGHQWKWTLLRAGGMRLDGGGMFGVVPKTIWSKLSPPDDANRIALETNCLLLEDGAKRVLIETGFGGKWSPKERGFYDLAPRTIIDALNERGIDPESIDDVIVTHLHFDHAGGLTHLDGSGEAVSTFKRARIHAQKREWDDAIANRAVMTRTYLRNHLDPVRGQMQLCDGPGEILPGIEVEPGPGHTWGQQVVRFRDEQGVIAFPGDVMPTVNHVGAAFSMGYDIEPYTAMETKLALLARAADEGWRVVLDHEPGEPVHHVVRDADHAGRFGLIA